MVSTARAAADAAAANNAKGVASKGIKGWFLRQPKWLRVTMIVVLILLLPMIISVIIGLVKAVVALIGGGVRSIKTRLSKPIPGQQSPTPAPEKESLEGK
jgi:hypothetical protein